MDTTVAVWLHYSQGAALTNKGRAFLQRARRFIALFGDS